MNFNPEIFRAYDIRGIYGRDFDNEFAFQLGAALVNYLNRKKFLVANDSRGFSDGLAKSLMNGITSAGGDVEYLGLSTTPFFNFVFYKLKVNGGVMITASHNGPEYGGFKIFGEDGQPIGIDSGLTVIRDFVSGGRFEVSKYGGRLNGLNRPEFLKKYENFLVKKSDIKPGELENARVRIESGGVALEIVEHVFRGLKIKSRESDFDISFSFDGDADRLSVFDGHGNKIRMDSVVALIAQNEIGFWSKPKIVCDSRFSKGVIEKFNEWGTRNFRSRVGRTFVMEEMMKRKADLAGELSGHIFFKENHYKEEPLLALLKILKILNKAKEDINTLTKPFETWFNSGEINIKIQDKRQAVARIMRLIKEKYSDCRLDMLDGVTVEYNDPAGGKASWWFNVRPSNTEPLIRLVVEAKTKDLLDEKVTELSELVQTHQ